MAVATYQYNGRTVAAAYSITDEQIRQLEEVTSTSVGFAHRCLKVPGR
jgi:hypothetical protein